MKKFFNLATLVSVTLFASTIFQADVKADDGLVSSTIALYKSSTWTNSVYYFVVRQGAHATINYCAKGAAFTGNPADPAQLQAFYSTSCPKSWMQSSYSNPNGTGFSTVTHVAGTNGASGSVIITNSYSQSSSGQINTAAGFQTFAFDLDLGVNPANSVIMEQGASIVYQGSENPTLNSYKQTFTYLGAFTMDAAPVVN